MSTKALTAKLSSAANRLQPALRLLGYLRHHIEHGSPAEGGFLARMDELAADLELELHSLEATVGVVTQATLFDEGTLGLTPDDAAAEEEYAAEDVPASATITFLVDCDFCGKECEASGNHHACEHCGKGFDIVD